jgi:hypothetical protein
MSTPASRQAGAYRVGDAERTRTVELLREAHAAGYLQLDETDGRLGSALAARTRDELDRLVADLPPEWRARQQGGPAPTPARRRGATADSWVLPLLIALAVVGLVVLLAVTDGFFFPWPLLWFWFIFGGRRRWGAWSTRRF